MSAVTAAGVMTAAAGLGLICLSRRLARPARCRCGNCATESALAPWKRRALAVTRPGPGWAARTRYGLRPGEYAERVRLGMPMWHPDWITGELAEDREELLAEMDAELEDM